MHKRKGERERGSQRRRGKSREREGEREGGEERKGRQREHRWGTCGLPRWTHSGLHLAGVREGLSAHLETVPRAGLQLSSQHPHQSQPLPRLPPAAVSCLAHRVTGWGLSPHLTLAALSQVGKVQAGPSEHIRPQVHENMCISLERRHPEGGVLGGVPPDSRGARILLSSGLWRGRVNPPSQVHDGQNSVPAAVSLATSPGSSQAWEAQGCVQGHRGRKGSLSPL